MCTDSYGVRAAAIVNRLLEDDFDFTDEVEALDYRSALREYGYTTNPRAPASPYRKLFKLDPPWDIGSDWSAFTWSGLVVSLLRRTRVGDSGEQLTEWFGAVLSTDSADPHNPRATPQANTKLVVKTPDIEGSRLRYFLEQIEEVIGQASVIKDWQERGQVLDRFRKIGQSISESIEDDSAYDFDELLSSMEPLTQIDIAAIRRVFRGMGFGVSVYRRRSSKGPQELCVTAVPRSLDRRITRSDMDRIYEDLRRHFAEIADYGYKGYTVTVFCHNSTIKLQPGQAMPRGETDRVYITIRHDPERQVNEVNGYGDGLPDGFEFAGYS